MYDGMKRAFGPRPIKLVPLKSSSGHIITDRNKQMEQGSKKPPSGRPEQVYFGLRQVTFRDHLPDAYGQAPSQNPLSAK